MKKVVSVNELRFGVYVYKLDRPWVETPFMFQGFVINNQKQIEILKQYCKHVFIDTEQGDDITRRHSVLDTITTRVIYEEKTPVRQELPAARQAQVKTAVVLKNVFGSVQAGKALDAPRIQEAVSNMTDSVIRNPDAMLLLAKLREKGKHTLDRAMGASIYMLTFGRFLHLPRDQLDILGMLGLLQDVGKLRLPASVLNTPGPLSKAEMKICRSHVEHSVEILDEAGGFPPEFSKLASLHHERLDGSGYPNGLKGEKIGLLGGIAGLIDVFDAVTNPRPYGPTLAPSNALNMLYGLRDTHFDGPLVEQLIQCIGIYPVGSVVELNSSEIGIVIAPNPTMRLSPKVMVVFDSENNRLKKPKIVERAAIRRSLELEQGELGIDVSEFFL